MCISGYLLLMPRIYPSISIFNFHARRAYMEIDSVFTFVCLSTPQDVVEEVVQTENMMDIMEKGNTDMLLETKQERFSRILMPPHL